LNKRKTAEVLCSGTVVCCCLFAIVSCGPGSRGEKWIIPENYSGWLRLDYAVNGAPPLPLESGAYLVRMPSTGRLETSSPYNGSINKDEFLVVTSHGLEKLALSQQRMAVDKPAIQGLAVQSVFGFLKVVSGSIQKPGTCVFVGTRPEFKANFQDCQGWLAGESEPPEFKRHLVLRDPGDPPVK
jgi:hypothetical protein